MMSFLFCISLFICTWGEILGAARGDWLRYMKHIRSATLTVRGLWGLEDGYMGVFVLRYGVAVEGGIYKALLDKVFSSL